MGSNGMNMNAWNVLEWIVFAIALLWAIMTNISVRQHYMTSDEPSLPANAIAMTQMVIIVIIAVFHYSPLHLLWLFLLSYVMGFIALRVRIIGRLAWLYGYLIAYTIRSNW
jgi:ABC-type xylose transport system permease subunit